MTNEKKSRKEQILAYKEKPTTGGVYGIKNTVNGKIFLEAAIDLNGSLNRFAFSQITNSCVSMKLQKDWTEYGAKAFEFMIIQQVEKKPEESDKEFAIRLKELEKLQRSRYEMDQIY